MKQVRDPMGSDEWIDCGADSDEPAVRLFLNEQGYDEADHDPGRPFTLEVRDDEDDAAPRKIEARVIPTHFQVGRGR